MRFWEAMKALEEGKKVRPIAEAEETIFIHRGCHFYINEWSINKEWELYDDQPELSFSDVVKGLREGKKFKRKDWGKFCEIKIQGTEILRATLENYIPTIEDFEATDWIEVRE